MEGLDYRKEINPLAPAGRGSGRGGRPLNPLIFRRRDYPLPGPFIRSSRLQPQGGGDSFTVYGHLENVRLKHCVDFVLGGAAAGRLVDGRRVDDPVRGISVDHAADHFDQAMKLADGNRDFLSQRVRRRRRVDFPKAFLGFPDMTVQTGDQRLELGPQIDG